MSVFDAHGSIISESIANAFSVIDAECHLVATDCPIKLHSLQLFVYFSRGLRDNVSYYSIIEFAAL